MFIEATKILREMGHGHDFDLLIILHQLRVLYPIAHESRSKGFFLNVHLRPAYFQGGNLH